jgi:carbamoyl-phosphate synthase large subunit
MGKYKILLEASGCLSSHYMIKAVKEAGYLVCGSDISDFNSAKYFCDDFIIFPKVSDSLLWEKVERSLKEHNINVVIPTFDEMMIDWAKMSEHFKNEGINVVISPLETIEICQDKWKTYEFFNSIDVSTPRTSLEAEYSLIKPRNGRGGEGIFENDFLKEIDMKNLISQEKVTGQEYTVDVFFDRNGLPVYIIPRMRIDIKDGKSTKGIVVKNDKIDEAIRFISTKIKFVGAINFQLFKKGNGELIFLEINPRLAGGSALGFCASENWVSLMVRNIIEEKEIEPVKINYEAKMMRYYAECFI